MGAPRLDPAVSDGSGRRPIIESRGRAAGPWMASELRLRSVRRHACRGPQCARSAAVWPTAAARGGLPAIRYGALSMKKGRWSNAITIFGARRGSSGAARSALFGPAGHYVHQAPQRAACEGGTREADGAHSRTVDVGKNAICDSRRLREFAADQLAARQEPSTHNDGACSVS